MSTFVFLSSSLGVERHYRLVRYLSDYWKKLVDRLRTLRAPLSLLGQGFISKIITIKVSFLSVLNRD
jgi:hypothetical protein